MAPERLTCIFHKQDPIVAPRRSSDDLPTHVKGIVRWYPDAEPQAGYYVPKKYSPSRDFEPLEFINNQWFGLFRHPETSTTHLCTRASAAIPIVNRLGIGYWDITDPEHPDFTLGTIETIDVDPPSPPPSSNNTVAIYVTPPKNTPAPQTHYSGPTPGLTIASTSTVTFLLHQVPPLFPHNLSQPSLCQLALLEDEAEEEVEAEERHQQQQPPQLHPMEACGAYNPQSLTEPAP